MITIQFYFFYSFRSHVVVGSMAGPEVTEGSETWTAINFTESFPFTLMSYMSFSTLRGNTVTFRSTQKGSTQAQMLGCICQKDWLQGSGCGYIE